MSGFVKNRALLSMVLETGKPRSRTVPGEVSLCHLLVESRREDEREGRWKEGEGEDTGLKSSFHWEPVTGITNALPH